ncbi:MAG: 2,3-bisphosphoglycerate-independent phosphoglycerate mutase [Candidatus Woesebacteria bacterium GW2011_GWA1_39_21]|uniref:2,3-bisphosphoglycerate-independent phosphoglycerate mutase n=1 Tax=Candidatus Woesebacteria bacterium GW2011_GWA1_39_21 TaxID=1618550 RepID=A0A0G0QLB8_9BACT|nr:MAG: 2,3-bisphosphoglycerate-independent phosphoglycerate mutase [Candidatus Woesebacteria bacterium GW2011_GWA1_39_21]
MVENNKLEKSVVKPHVLLILDGFGIAPMSSGNAISAARTPNLTYFRANYPYSKLIAAGESVGLPANEAGNSEVGHLAIGTGRVIYQSLPRINMAIKDGGFFENKAFLQAIIHTRNNNSRLHIMGLASSGNVHSSTAHLMALLELLRRNNVRNACLHLFTDGRDAPPTDAVNVVKKISDYLSEVKVAQIASVSGRYWAMDRDARWDRTKKAYDAIVNGVGVKASDPVSAISSSYQTNITDEFIEPTIIENNGAPVGVVNDNDAVIFFNFRIDRPRQLTMAFTFSDFEDLKVVEFGYTPHGKQKHRKDSEKAEGPTFQRGKVPKNLFFVTMTEYQKNLPVSAIAFPPEVIINSFPEMLSKSGYRQFHLTESEKERMVTFYFDGLRDQRYEGEDVVIVSSPNVATYDKKPEMSVFKVVSEFKKAMLKDCYHFIIMNFANPDMVAHTGNLKATIKAIEYVDSAVGSIAAITLKAGGTLYITADHGNAEELLTFPLGTFFYTTSSGVMNTEHSNSPVPFYIIANRFKGEPSILKDGNLSDVAPTIMDLMGVPKPPEMTGKSLINKASLAEK